MAGVRVSVGGAAVRPDEYQLSFNDIIGRTPGSGRDPDKAKKGLFQNRKGDIMLAYGKDMQFLEDVDGVSTGFSRAGLVVLNGKNGPRPVKSDNGPGTAKNWKPYTGAPVSLAATA